MNKKDIKAKVFNKLISPPCPNCGSYEIKPLGMKPPMIMRGDQLMEALSKRRGWILERFECHKCGTKFDRGGSAVINDPKGKWVKGIKYEKENESK